MHNYLLHIIEAISTGIKIAMCIASLAHAAVTGTEATATTVATAAQYGLNTALLSCPITWIIIIIIALIAAFYALIAAINKFAHTSISATGVICGVFTFAAALVGNLFLSMINFVMDLFATLWNFIASFVNFFANVFNDPVGSIARLFFDLVDTILSLLESVASAIDTLFGSNLSGAVSGWRDSLSGWVDDKFGKGEEIMATVCPEEYHFDRFEYSSAWDKGYNFGKGIEDKISDFDPSSLFKNNDIPSPEDYQNDLSDFSGEQPLDFGGGLDDIGGGVSDIASDTEDIADSLEISEEDLKYLRDIAEQETVNRFTTAEVKIEQVNNNNFTSDLDLDGVVAGLTNAMDEAVEIIAEGVHT